MNITKPILSSSDRAALPNEAPAPAIALINSQMGENIGAASRAMANFGLDELILVAPRDGWPNEKAFAVSAGATWPLDKAIICNSTNEALQNKTVVFATSGTPRQIDKPLISPAEAVKLIDVAINNGEKPIILFGSERFGLSQMDLISADYIVTYPTSFRFPSLNLAQSVAIFCYLWATRDGDKMPQGWDIKNGEMAPRKYFDNLFDFLTNELDELGFFWPIDRRENMIEVLRSALIRAKFSESEINILRGAIRVISEGPRRRFSELQIEHKRKNIADYCKKNQLGELIDAIIENNKALAIIKNDLGQKTYKIIFEKNNILEFIQT